MRFKMMAAVAAAFITVPVAAQTADPATPAATPAATPKKEKKICRRVDVTGSILGSRAVCHTKVEWAQIDEANGRNTDQVLGNSRRSGGTGNGQF